MSGHLITRPAHLEPCHGCGRHILAAVTSGRTIAADCTALTLTAEITARLTGRHTYDVTATGRTVYLIYRDQFRTAAPRIYSVVADHNCGALPRYRLIPPKKPVKEKRPVKTAANFRERIPF
jgi:hypothetical protein